MAARARLASFPELLGLFSQLFSDLSGELQTDYGATGPYVDGTLDLIHVTRLATDFCGPTSYREFARPAARRGPD
jgi:hypothetical protein